VNRDDDLTITLSRKFVIELCEALQARADSWRKTAEFIELGYISDDPFVCENCDDAEEATRFAERYEGIVRGIEAQIRR
jgi:hypothetical protein